MDYQSLRLFTKKYYLYFIIAVAAVITAFLVFRYFTPFGAIVKYQFSSMLDRDKPSKIKGAEETSSFNPTQAGVLQIPQQTIRQNTVTFNLKLITQPIEGVWVNLRFKGNPKEIKIGVRGSEKVNYQYQPLYNQLLNLLTWSQSTSGETTFWQKGKKYKNIFELLSKLPASDEAKIATYFFNPSDILIKEHSVSSQNNLIIEKNLRGSHDLFIRVDKMPFILNIEKQDANVYRGQDILLIQVYQDDKKIVEKEIPDDGVTDASSLKMSLQSERIKIINLPTGIYKVVLLDKSEGSDVRITKIETNQQALVFASHIFLYDNQPTNLWTNSKIINIPIINKNNAQIAKLDDKTNLDISKPERPYKFDLKSMEINKDQEIHKLTINKNLLTINGDGYFAFSEDSFFDPKSIKTVDLSTVSDIDKIDYIIANYQPVKREGDWKVAQAYFDPKDIKIDGNKLYFSLESPELSSYGGEIIIDNLEVTVKKPGWIKAVSPTPQITEEKKAPNFFQKIINFFKNIFSKKENVPKPTDDNLSPTTEPSPTSEPTPTPRFQDLIKITVLNGGAGKGSAGKFASVLKNNGFADSVASNAAVFDYKNAVMKYQKTDSQPFKEAVAEVKKLLMQDYNFVTEERTEKEPMKITVILGENPKEVTPTLTKTPEATATPIVKPTP
jgi:hypothetical protein